MSAAVLQLRHAYKTFTAGGSHGRRVTALDDVSLAVGEGEIVALVGQSGSGKSTLGRVVVRLERLDRGESLFEGVEYSRMAERPMRRLRRRMHLVLQDPYQSLHPAMRIGAAVAEPLEIARAGDARSPRVAEALEEVGLTPAANYLRRFPHELSGGERQRVVLARALVGRPRLVVADEPTSMVDATLRASIVKLIRDLRDSHGIAFLVITHDLDMAGAVAEQVAVMQRGRLVECGRTAEVFTSPTHDYTKALLRAAAEVGRLTTCP
ncbi:MAG: peptide/nickel transport system ATP-binding protein [Acidimicrobiaceae bacterium]|nr:peptide/nickel transport system ATP-binding protein [Acidimicrobiaceae bacterium]MDQ1392646.1 peptide/nickel transport system ATP-binding protein [Acidimicrobiaceae bacterium]MDQ1420449.1 peptide/nickel transport system ATP-binding protein [Acidimicrobiaceae bacterium]